MSEHTQREDRRYVLRSLVLAARVTGTSVNALIIDALHHEIERVRQDEEFTSRAKRLLERDRKLLERLAR